MKPCSRLGILGILTVPILFAPLVLAGPTSAASAVVGIPVTASHPPNSPDPGGMSDMHDMPGMENMPGMEESTPDGHTGHGSSEVASTGPEPARGVVLAGFGIFNLLVLLVAAVVRYSGSGSRRSRRNTVRSASKPTSTPLKPTSEQQPS